MKINFIIILATYLIASVIRGLTGVFFNPFFDKFDLILFIKDILIWTLSYVTVSLVVSKFTKQKNS